MKDIPSSIFRRMTPGLILGLAVFIGLALLGGIEQVSMEILKFQWRFFLIAIAFELVNYAFRFIKWRFLLGRIGVRRIPLAQCLRFFIAGFPLAIIPRKASDVIKGVWLMHQTGSPVDRGMSVVALERVSDTFSCLILFVSGIVAFPQYAPFFATFFVIFILIVVLSQIKPVMSWFLDAGDKINLFGTVFQNIRKFYEGSFSLFHPGAIFISILLGIISWTSEGAGFYFILVGLGITPSNQLFAMSIFTLSLSTIIGAASALPGGLGAVEISIAGMLTLILHEQPAVATTATLLIRMATLWFGVLLGLATWALSPDLPGLVHTNQTAAET
jgi:glycosyltransferase 2 family protein